VSLELVLKSESAQVLASLVRVLGDLSRAEDALHDACLRALAVWPRDGVPENPAAWLTTVAKNLAFDALRRSQKNPASASIDAAQALGETPEPRDDALSMGVDDDLLRLLFTCCHPSLAPQAQVALTLRTLGGLSTAEIARAFHEPEPTTAQRLVRAKSKIRDARIPYIVPSRRDLPERLESVRAVVYLIFNEGYSTTEGPSLIRVDLCAEAIRIGRWLMRVFPADAEVLGLLSLMLLHDARRNARVDATGGLVLLEHQDRSKWDQPSIDEGVAILDRALSLRRSGPYQIQAAIAALHAQAQSTETTDWAQIKLLYDGLLEVHPTPTVALNRAVAVSMTEGLDTALLALDAIDASAFEHSHWLEATRADFLRRLGRRREAADAYSRALLKVRNAAERRFLEERRKSIEPL
jgi:RNA polymerase sigma-70 factor (ECF subfamily)